MYPKHHNYYRRGAGCAPIKTLNLSHNFSCATSLQVLPYLINGRKAKAPYYKQKPSESITGLTRAAVITEEDVAS